jgi:ATP-dependent RNA helicase HelY
VYEPRREDAGIVREYPRGRFREVFEATEQRWAELSVLEEQRKLPQTEPLSAALASATFRWAQGGRLDAVLRDTDLAAGDFVRWMKQVIDLLDQLSLVADGELGRTARSAIDAVRRGIVAYSSVG